MSVSVTFSCDGCDAKADGTRRLQRRFKAAFTGLDYGFGRYEYDTPQDVAPEGWIAFDPYTGCCYCPSCWTSIEES